MDLGARIEAGMVVVVLLRVLVGDDGRLLILPHQALHDETLAHVVDLLLDVRILVVAGFLRFREEQVVQDQVLDELPLAIRRREIGARWSREPVDLGEDLGAGELLAGVGGDDVRRLLGRAGGLSGGSLGRRGCGTGLLLRLLATRGEQYGAARGDHVTGAHRPGRIAQRRAQSQFSVAAEADGESSWRRRASASATPAQIPDVSTTTSRGDAVRLGTNSW